MQLEIFSGTDSITNDVIETAADSITNGVIEPQNTALLRFLKRDKSLGGLGSVNEYYVGKTNNFYYRYSYRVGKRTRHKHIPGGNIYSNLAIRRRDQVQQAINRDASTPEILEMIDCFKKA